MSKRLSFSIAVNLLTENFKKGTNTVKNSLKSMQMQIITFAAALGAGGLGLSGLLTRFRDVARETNRVLTALKNVSNGTRGFADNLRFVNDLANKYGLEVNALIGNYAKFTASATQANMPMDQQKKIFESLSRASAAFALSADETNGVFLALSQMMGKGKISMEELRKQMGEKLPVAIAAMAKALGVSVGQMEKLIGSGKVMAADVLPKFADALNEMIPNVDTDNLETSLSRLSNTFGDIVNASGFQNKYKALIDWLTNALKTAGNNLKNIVVGIVASIMFVVTNSLSKVYRGYVTNGQQIIQNANTTHNKLRVAIAKRVEAEIALEQAKLKHFLASGQKQVAAAREVEKAKQVLSARTTAVNVAHEDAKAAAAQAAAIRSRGFWLTSWAAITGSAKKLVASLKSMWSAFSPAIIMSAIIALVGYFKNMYDEAKRVKNIFAEYKKEAASVDNTSEIKMLQAQLSIMNDKKRGQNEINAAQAALNKMLGVEGKNQSELNKLVAKRIELLKEAARADFYARKIPESEERMRKLAHDNGLSLTEATQIARDGHGTDYSYIGQQKTLVAIEKAYKAKGKGNKAANLDALNAISEIAQELRVWDDANEQLKKAVNKSNTITNNGGSGNTDPDKNALSAAEKRLEALRKLDEEDRKRQIEKRKFDLEMQQKAIDLLDDSFDKRIKETLINLEKEKLSIEEIQNDLLKQQTDYAKDKYVSVKGSDKGFEAYFADLKKSNFKDKNGTDILPEGLRPADIEKQVGELLKAAQDAQRKGLKTINKELSQMLREQQLMFASDLDKKLADLDTYYREQLIKAGSNAELIAKIESNKKRETQTVKTDDKLNKIDFQEQLKQERIAGLESIGMTELVEEKKLEVTKEYIQKRIDALDVLASMGDQEAYKQMDLLKASLKKLDTQKPAKSLKSLADKAIFDRIKRGFESAGDSAAEAEKKTASLLGAISQKAAIVANVVSELQSMFGGLDESLDMALETVGNIAQGFASGGIVGGAMAVVSEGMKLFSKASEAAARHQKALEEIAQARLQSQRAYNLLLKEQNLLLKEAVSVFGEKQITRAANAIENYKTTLQDIQKAIQGEAPVYIEPKNPYDISSSLKEYQKQKEAYEKGYGKLADQQIVTGHKKTGLFGWGKGKDTYSSILDAYPDLIDSENKLNKERLQAIINTEKMSDETKNYLQNLLDLEDAAEAAQEELKNYLQSTFGSLGDDLMSSLENAIKDRSVNAWEEFGKAGSKVIEQLGKQLAYQLFFADKLKKLQSDIENIYGSGKSEEDIARDVTTLLGNFYKNIGKDMENAQGFMENWQKEAAKYGFDLWNDVNQTASSKGFQSMDQDTGDRLDGRFDALQMSGLRIEGFLSTISVYTNNIQNISLQTNSELKKHTEILNEMKTIHLNSFYQIEGTKDFLKSMNDAMAKIDKNTSRL
jgi:tape measure domain-containing protein|nr:MAG TPA: Tail tape measure [Caudoviricetes sp.]